MKNKNVDPKIKIVESVLEYWHTMEFLVQDALPQLTYEEKKKNQEAVRKAHTGNGGPKVLRVLVSLERGSSFLEAAKTEAEKHGMTCWGNLTFYVGKSRREACIQRISAALGEEDDRPEINNEEIAWFSLQTSPEGAYISQTFSLSTIIWAMNHVAEAGVKPLSECLSEESYRDDMQVYEEKLQMWGKRNCTDKAEDEESGQYEQELNGDFTEITVEDIAGINDEIYSSYIKKLLGENLSAGKKQDFECMMLFQIYQDEEAREKYSDDDYLGLGRAFFADDVKMVLSAARTDGLRCASFMGKGLADYIAGAYNEYYPEKSICSSGSRFDLEHAGEGEEGKEGLLEFFTDVLDVRRAPVGKWPSRFMPSLMQQTAVNLATDESTGPVFSVNGPPGTGKTTLLKEIIVNHIIEKAMLLSEYDRPDDAFEKCFFQHGEKKSGGYSDWYPNYYKLKDDKINDYSILVTSCNNAAVENITKELPLEKGITGALNWGPDDSGEMKQELEEIQKLFTAEESPKSEQLYCKDGAKSGVYKDIYFTEYARELVDDQGAWGLISASLGKRSNIHKFYQNVLRPLDSDFYRNEKIDARLDTYRQARRRLLEQRARVEKLRDSLARNCEDVKYIREYSRDMEKKLGQLDEEKDRLERRTKECSTQLESLTTPLKQLEEELLKREQYMEKCKEDWRWAWVEYERVYDEYKDKQNKSDELNKNKGIFRRFFRQSAVREDERQAAVLAAEAQELKREAVILKEEGDRRKAAYEKSRQLTEMSRSRLKECDGIAQKLEKEQSEIRKRLRDIQVEYAGIRNRLTAEISKYKNKLRHQMEAFGDTGSFVPLDEAFIEGMLSRDEKESTRIQTANPWFTNHYNREREKLFYYSLQLTKEFVLSSRCCFRNFRNLALLWQETQEDNEKVIFHPEDREACFVPLLQNLFLLVPVISTTFASVGNFLKDIKFPGALGTLIVDEAGQAPPQMAVGALYRSRRAVIVGDPRQVEPVVTDDLQLLKKAFKEDVYKPYKSKKISVQQFADTINPYGTYLENEKNEKEWVGCPLVVHRRCISPMYDISNQISYNNTMKQQTAAPGKEKEASFCYSGSRWINVKGREKGRKNHYVEAQGKRVLEILETAFAKADAPSLFIITPFTSVKTGMIKCIEDHLKGSRNSILYEKREMVTAWMYKNIGTVHTFQGKEANEVIFLLGCDTGKEAFGAIRWVNANIVNVAVTRAKFRLYMIGDENAWQASPYISQAKSIIDLYALREVSEIVNGTADESFEEKKKKALFFCDKLPTAESFSMDVYEDEDGSLEYTGDSGIFLNELQGGGLLLNELTDEQLEGYGFTRAAFDSLIPRVRVNIEWGIKLYSMLKRFVKEYGIAGLDASCCGILFCKAAELQVKDCLAEGMKKRLPEFKVSIPGSKGGRLKEAAVEKMTLGTFCAVLRAEGNRQILAEYMISKGRNKYGVRWWEKYNDKLLQCKELRNACCHSGAFPWKKLDQLLIVLFLWDRSREEPVMDGLVRDSEAGRYLIGL